MHIMVELGNGAKDNSVGIPIGHNWRDATAAESCCVRSGDGRWGQSGTFRLNRTVH